jgi:hypothetical protein
VCPVRALAVAAAERNIPGSSTVPDARGCW